MTEASSRVEGGVPVQNFTMKTSSKVAIGVGAVALAVFGTLGVLGMLHARGMVTLPRALSTIGTVAKASVLLGVGGAFGFGAILYGACSKRQADVVGDDMSVVEVEEDEEDRLEEEGRKKAMEEELLSYLPVGHYYLLKYSPKEGYECCYNHSQQGRCRIILSDQEYMRYLREHKVMGFNALQFQKVAVESQRAARVAPQ